MFSAWGAVPSMLRAESSCNATLPKALRDFDKKVLVDSNVKQLYVQMPVIWMVPVKREEIVWGHRYNCPVYKTSERRGMLSTTGHSTNYVTSIKLPMMDDHQQKRWIKAGVACLTQTDD